MTDIWSRFLINLRNKCNFCSFSWEMEKEVRSLEVWSILISVTVAHEPWKFEIYMQNKLRFLFRLVKFPAFVETKDLSPVLGPVLSQKNPAHIVTP
jgi:hypothetical protein